MAEFTEQEKQDILKAAREITRALDESMRADDEKNLSAGTGTNDLKFEQVKAGRVLVLEHLSGEDTTSAATRVRIGYYNGHALNWLRCQPAPLATEVVAFDGRVLLREGMYPIVRFEGATSGDDLYATLNGYYIKT